jgi:hypothetical protein
MQLIIKLPPSTHCVLGPLFRAAVQVEVLAVVDTVIVADPALVPVIFTRLVAPILSVGGSWAAEGPAVIEAVSVTAPVNPPLGVTVISELFPAVDPAVTVTFVPLTVMSGVGTGLTVTGSEPDEEA